MQLKIVCVRDQDTLIYLNLCGHCKSLAPEILSWYPAIKLRGISCGSIAKNRVFDQD